MAPSNHHLQFLIFGKIRANILRTVWRNSFCTNPAVQPRIVKQHRMVGRTL